MGGITVWSCTDIRLITQKEQMTLAQATHDASDRGNNRHDTVRQMPLRRGEQVNRVQNTYVESQEYQEDHKRYDEDNGSKTLPKKTK